MRSNIVLTESQWSALFSVAHGADIYDRQVAAALRNVEKLAPGLVDITKPMMYHGDGTDRVPYFGAIATKKGKAALKKYISGEGA